MLSNISQYLEKISKVYNENVFLKKNVVEVLKEYLKVEIADKNILFKEGVLKIKLSPVFRTELCIKKKKIIKDINERMGKEIIFDIK